MCRCGDSSDQSRPLKNAIRSASSRARWRPLSVISYSPLAAFLAEASAYSTSASVSVVSWSSSPGSSSGLPMRSPPCHASAHIRRRRHWRRACRASCRTNRPAGPLTARDFTYGRQRVRGRTWSSGVGSTSSCANSCAGMSCSDRGQPVRNVRRDQPRRLRHTVRLNHPHRPLGAGTFDVRDVAAPPGHTSSAKAEFVGAVFGQKRCGPIHQLTTHVGSCVGHHRAPAVDDAS